MILSIDDDKIYEITVTMIYYDYLPILVTDPGILIDNSDVHE